MTLARHSGGWVIFFTFVVALVLTVLPLPEWAQAFRPQWYALVLIYWCMAVPQRVGIGVAWMLGIAVDVLTGTLLGQHALSLSIIAFSTLKLHQRVRLFPLWQQSLIVLVLLTLNQLISLWIMGVTGQWTPGLVYWAPSPIGMLLWPWLFIILRDVRRTFRVA